MQNPYAPPKDFGMLPGALVPPGSPRGFGTREVLEAAWEITKKHWPVLVAAFAVWTVPASLVSAFPVAMVALQLVEPNSAEYWGLYLLTTVAAQIVGFFFQVGYIRIVVAAARGQTPQFMDIFSGFDRFFAIIAIALVTILPETLGLVLLIVPGVIIFLGFSLATFYCVDQRLGPIASLRESWRAMRGHKLATFVFLCVAFLIYMASFVVCCVGSFASFGLLYVAWAIIYIRLSGYEQAPFQTQGAY